MQDMTPELARPPGQAESPTLTEDLRLLAQDARALAEAEIAFQKSRVAYASAEGRKIALFGVVALLLAFFGAMALVVGTVIALGPVLTPWGAMAAVTLVLLVGAALCGLSAKARLSRTIQAVSDKKGA